MAASNPRRNTALRLAVAAVAVAVPLLAHAQGGYELTSGAVGGGGVSTSSGGGFELRGAVGQAVAGDAVGDGLRLTAGAMVVKPEYVFRLQLEASWNLISIPLEPLDPRVEELLAGAHTGPVWAWLPDGYVRKDRFEPVSAHWVYCLAPAEIFVRGWEVEDPRTALLAGWNAVGPPDTAPFDPVALPLRAQPCGPVTRHHVFCWRPDLGEHVPVDDDLDCGLGYWIYAHEDTVVTWRE